MKETKTMQVSVNQEDYMIDAYQSFGFELLSTQEVKTKDSHLERHGDTIYNVTETEHYIKLTFTRDDNMPFYSELTKQQNEFENAQHAIMKKPKLNLLLAILGLLLYVAPGVLYIVWYIVKSKKVKTNNEECFNRMETAISQGKEIIRKIESKNS
ncbi:MAG: hypothetical protein J1F32_05265 [Erysipelotrichales bacterium]|nr:hypothetical protein [Erysipelotrichales bacterium]